jgi:peptidoglycan/LPS O-acetylase OafA/YrhL
MRYHALDSLRGVAALIVVIYHCLLVIPAFEAPLFGYGKSIYAAPDLWTGLVTLVPLRILWAGREAVIFFFVLSGFVLTLPFIGERPPRYASFVVKRFFRLYIPFAIMIGIAAGAWVAIAPESQVELSDWFNNSWSEQPVLGVVLRHLAMTGEMSLNNVSWTLVIEWRVALLFPLLVLMSRISPPATLVGSLALAIIYMTSTSLETIRVPYTIYYFIYFVIGIIVALYLQPMLNALRRLGTEGTVALWIAFYILLNIRWLTPLGAPLTDIGNGIAAALLIGLVLTSPRLQSFLMVRQLQWLGTVSYSLYLVHVPLLMAVIHLLPTTAPVYLALLMVPPASLLIAHLFHRLVEHPSMLAGRVVGGWVDDITGLRSRPRGKES